LTSSGTSSSFEGPDTLDNILSALSAPEDPALISILGIENNFIGNLYRPLQDGRIFQGYDGTIHVIGMDTMIWQGGLPVCSEDFQVLPKSARVFVEKQVK